MCWALVKYSVQFLAFDGVSCIDCLDTNAESASNEIEAGDMKELEDATTEAVIASYGVMM